MIRRSILLIGIVIGCFCSCSGRERQGDRGTDSLVLELPLPEVPKALTAPVERADYILHHFWDPMDFRDTLRSRDKTFMELNLVNFMSLFPHGSERATSESIGRLLGATSGDTASFHLVTDILERYLNDPNSPMRHEGHYILYLEELLRLPGLSEYDRLRPAYRLQTAKKNRPGTTATDFAYTDRDGRRHTLHGTAADRRLLLLFYDPECGHCSEILEQVKASAVLREQIERKELAVLAVYTEGNRPLWHETKASLPPAWTVGIDESRIVERELYSIPAMPVMYLLDADKTVLLKDARLEEIEARR